MLMNRSQIQVGELIVNEQIADDCKQIFTELFMQEYEIASMYLLEKYWTGDGVTMDTASIEQNNSSAFNYRVVPGTDSLSNHAKGYAIDLNPLQNPYVTYRKDGSFRTYYKDMEKYIDRSSGADSLSNHAKGYAIDLNPLQNPYVTYRKDGSFRTYYKDMEKYIDRSSGAAHMITHEDAAYQTFSKYGFTWGGDWQSSKDYQHFQKVVE